MNTLANQLAISIVVLCNFFILHSDHFYIRQCLRRGVIIYLLVIVHQIGLIQGIIVISGPCIDLILTLF
jgi:hypothetical protein